MLKIRKKNLRKTLYTQIHEYIKQVMHLKIYDITILKGVRDLLYLFIVVYCLGQSVFYLLDLL